MSKEELMRLFNNNVEYTFRDRGKTWVLDKEEFYKNIK